MDVPTAWRQPLRSYLTCPQAKRRGEKIGMAMSSMMRYSRHRCSFLFAVGRVNKSLGGSWSSRQGIFIAHVLDPILGNDSTHCLRSLARIIVRRPRFRAESCPDLIAAYSAVLPVRAWLQASLIVRIKVFHSNSFQMHCLSDPPTTIGVILRVHARIQTRFSVRPRITTRSWTHWTRDRLPHAMQWLC